MNRAMPQIRSLAIGTLFGMLAAGAVADSLRACTPAEIAGLRIWQQGYTKWTRVPGDKIRFTWQVRFKNETRTELGAIRVRLVGSTLGRRSYTSAPIEIKSFRNISVPAVGTLLPYNKSEYVRDLNYDVPAKLWTTAFEMHLELAGASTFQQPTNLHDAGHLYSKLVGTPEPEVIAMFQKDPSLLKVRNADNFTAMLMAFGACSPKVIEYIGSHGGNYRDKSIRGSTIMHLAAINGYEGVLALAVKHGGKVDELTNGGRTPLMKAIIHGMPVGWNWLLKHGANPNLEPMKAGYTAAHMAIIEGQIEALKALVQAGVNPRSHDSQGFGWMHYAVENDVMVPYVAGLGVPVDDRAIRTGQTPLMLAVMGGDFNPQIALLKLGANPNLKDKSGRSCYDLAKGNNTLGTDRFFRDIVARYAVKR